MYPRNMFCFKYTCIIVNTLHKPDNKDDDDDDNNNNGLSIETWCMRAAFISTWENQRTLRRVLVFTHKTDIIQDRATDFTDYLNVVNSTI